jgi:adenylate cyclase
MFAKRVWIISAIALLCLVGVIALEQATPFAYLRLCNFYRDTVSRLGRQTVPNGDLFFLAIDSDSVGLDEIDIEQLYGLTNKQSEETRALTLMTQRWPWPREVYALILDRLVRAGAKVVMFDLTFPTETDGDAPFRMALDRYHEKVVIGSNFISGTAREYLTVKPSHTRPPDSLVPQTAPMDDRVGYTNFWPDEDEVVRRAQYRVTFEQVAGEPPQADSEQYVSLGARGLMKAGFADAIPPGLNGQLFRFTAPPGQGFPPHSVFEIFVPDYWKQNYGSGKFFQNKIIVVGAEGNWQHDDHATPFGTMAGPELHLNAINAALHHEFIHEVSGTTLMLVILGSALLAFALSLFVRSPWVRLGGLLLCNAGGASIALYIFDRASIFAPIVGPALELNGVVLVGLISDFALERLEKLQVRRTLEKYVSRDIVHEMLDHPKLYAQSLGGVTKSVTILFSDIRGYSVVSAHSDPHTLVTQLNEYLTAMVECVFRFGGTLDKFIGDAVMAVWGNIRSNGADDDAANAVRAALAMQEELAGLNKKWLGNNWPPLRAGIAIHHGQVVVGNIGSPQRMEFTVIGDAVNMSWKLQELTKEIGYDFIVSEQVRLLVPDRTDFRSIGSANLKGVGEPVKLFTIGDSKFWSPNVLRDDLSAIDASEQILV